MDKYALFEVVEKYILFLIENRFSIKKAFVFGSYVSGNFNDDSDIDLALVMGNLSNGYLMQVELMKIGRKFDSRIEPHPFDEHDFNLTDPFAREVLEKGVQVY